MKKWVVVWGLMFLLCMAVPVRAAAANPREVKLRAGKTYSSYDITGDKKADTIQINRTGIQYYKGRVSYIKGLTVSVNGKTVYSFDNQFYYDVTAKLYTLKNKKPFLYLYAQSDNGDGPVCGVFQYKNGTLKQVINFQTFYKYGMHRSGKVKSVSGNKMKVTFSVMSSALSSVDIEMEYKYKGGTLKLVSRTGKATCYAMQRSGYLTARKKITAYKSATSAKKAFTIAKGTRVRVTNCYIKGSNIRYKVKSLSNGKTGWIKSPKTFLTGGKGLFEECYYAG